MEVEAFGGETVLVSAYPAMLANLAPAEVLLQGLVEQFARWGKTPESRDIPLRQFAPLIMSAEGSSLKCGDRLTSQEIEAYFGAARAAARITIIALSRPAPRPDFHPRAALDRQFKRI